MIVPFRFKAKRMEPTDSEIVPLRGKRVVATILAAPGVPVATSGPAPKMIGLSGESGLVPLDKQYLQTQF